MTHNLFAGTVSPKFEDLDVSPRFGDPNFANPGSSTAGAYRLKYPSPAMDAGIELKAPAIPGAGTGIFAGRTPWPETDFFGNPVDPSDAPNIGACNLKNGETISVRQIRDYVSQRKNMIFPNPATEFVYIRSLENSPDKVSVKIYDLQGRMVQKTDGVTKGPGKIFRLRLSKGLADGMYFIMVNDDESYKLIKGGRE